MFFSYKIQVSRVNLQAVMYAEMKMNNIYIKKYLPS
uniref:Uncharacterized protein n=1 Tax=Anguilla anguilla TaxID=7936 RepID=A0A0E9QCY5_ANGAN